MKKTKQELWLNRIIFGVLLASASVITYSLFYRQCVESLSGSGLYHSDMKAYILEMRGLNTKYSFPYPVFFKLAAFFDLFMGPASAVALATTVLNGFGICCTKWLLDQLAYDRFRKVFPDWRWLGGAGLSILAVSLFFVSMVYPPAGVYLPGIKYNYLGVFTANPFHNATYMAARPFGILSFVWFVRLLDSYETAPVRNTKTGLSKKQLADHLLFALFLLLATMTKPSFTIVLAGAAGLVLLYRLVRSGFRNLRQTVVLGLTFLPTFADLLYQYRGVFVPEEGAEGGIGFCFGRIWGLYCDNIPLAIGLAIGFPILVLLCNAGEWKTNTLYRFSWQIYLMGFAMAFFLYEKGFREPDFNFSWGYMYGIFFVFLGSLVVLIKATVECWSAGAKTGRSGAKTGRSATKYAGFAKNPAVIGVQWAAFICHLVCGLYYFYGFLQGKMYY